MSSQSSAQPGELLLILSPESLEDTLRTKMGYPSIPVLNNDSSSKRWWWRLNETHREIIWCPALNKYHFLSPWFPHLFPTLLMPSQPPSTLFPCSRRNRPSASLLGAFCSPSLLECPHLFSLLGWLLGDQMQWHFQIGPFWVPSTI